MSLTSATVVVVGALLPSHRAILAGASNFAAALVQIASACSPRVVDEAPDSLMGSVNIIEQFARLTKRVTTDEGGRQQSCLEG